MCKQNIKFSNNDMKGGKLNLFNNRNKTIISNNSIV